MEKQLGEKIHNPPIVTKDAVLLHGQRVADLELLTVPVGAAKAIVWLADIGGQWSHTAPMPVSEAQTYLDWIKEDAKSVRTLLEESGEAYRILIEELSETFQTRLDSIEASMVELVQKIRDEEE
jgi:hypothetical protein